MRYDEDREMQETLSLHERFFKKTVNYFRSDRLLLTDVQNSLPRPY